MSQPLSFEALSQAITGTAAAFRAINRLHAAGGPESKVFPPTYAGAVYAWEKRRIGDEVVPCVLLDSVQSQANRLEEALSVAYEEQRANFPVLKVDFRGIEGIGEVDEITTLDAPHRIFDAIFRDSLLDGTEFRSTDEGQAAERANIRNATALYELCPHSLVMGCWDSTGSRGGLGNKFARALVSEIIGVKAVAGVRTSSRIDPLGIEKCELYLAKDGKSWTVNPEEAKIEKKKPVMFGERGDRGKPSAINHGNVTPDITQYADNSPAHDPIKTQALNFHYEVKTRNGEIEQSNKFELEPTVTRGSVAAGGVTIAYALQTAVLSLPALRRLRFPDAGQAQTAERNAAARTVLAALALLALAEQRRLGYFLRSRCDLVPEVGQLEVELVRSAGDTEPFTLDAEQAADLFQQAVSQAEATGLTWRTDLPALKPKENFIELIRKSRETTAAEPDPAD